MPDDSIIYDPCEITIVLVELGERTSRARLYVVFARRGAERKHMKTLQQHIKNRTFSTVYLLCGSEPYLKNLYKNKLKEAVLQGDDGMNFNHFQGKGMDEKEIISIGNTMPFFAEKRVILVEDSGFFKSSGELADFIPEIPESTCLIFVESEIDKRNRLYKTVKAAGTIVELNGLGERDLLIWAASGLKKEGKKATEQTLRYFLSLAGTDMENIRSELEKVISYCLHREIVTEEDIDAVCVPQISGKIFDMIDAIAGKRQQEALSLYEDLLMLRESPNSILYLLTRQYNIMFQLKVMQREGVNPREMASAAGVPPFAVNKYLAGSRKFSEKELKSSIIQCIMTEEQIKTGRIQDVLGVELLLISFSKAA